MKLDPRQYDEMVSRASPPSPVVRDCAWAFLVGIAGPVIAFGTLASFVWGVLYWLLGKVG